MTAPTAIDIRTVLFPTDFSAHSDHAFVAALALARHFGARVQLLHVVHHASERDAAKDRLAGLARGVAPVAPGVAVAVGGPAAEIVRYAAQAKADLIVMGSHGRTGLAHAVRGSVAEAVMRQAPCLVLTIRRSVDVPVGVSTEPGEPPKATAGLPAGICLVCALPSGELVCDSCRNRIQAEALYWKLREQKVGS